MNLRNWQVFGFRGLRPKNRALVVLLLVVVFTGAGFLLLKGFSSTFKALGDPSGSAEEGLTVTGAVVEDVPTFTQDETPLAIAEEGAILQQEPAPEPDQPEYFRYDEQCAADVKKAEDDVADINTYLPEQENTLNTAKSEYDSKKLELESKIAELEKQLSDIRSELDSLKTTKESEISLIQQRVDTAKNELAAAQQKLDESKNSCQLVR